MGKVYNLIGTKAFEEKKRYLVIFLISKYCKEMY